MTLLETLWLRLVPASLWLAMAAPIVQALTWLVRPSSPKTHRIAWAAVLLTGIALVRIPINVTDAQSEFDRRQPVRRRCQSAVQWRPGFVDVDFRRTTVRAARQPCGGTTGFNETGRGTAGRCPHRIATRAYPGKGLTADRACGFAANGNSDLGHRFCRTPRAGRT